MTLLSRPSRGASVDVEIHIRTGESQKTFLDLKCSAPWRWDDIRVHSVPVPLDIASLSAQDLPVEEYGKLLQEALFSDQRVVSQYASARAAAVSDEVPLRFRLLVDPKDWLLQSIPWERLIDPVSGDLMSIGSGPIIFSRYIATNERRPLTSRARDELRALVAVASPAELPEGLDPLDRKEHIAIAREGLGEIRVTCLGDDGRPVTLSRIAEELSARPYDILYLVCHGGVRSGIPLLWLDPSVEGSDRQTPVRGEDFIRSVTAVATLPTLVVLASCDSAGSGEVRRPGKNDSPSGAASSVSGALGPQLAARGAGAVLAMQGRITVDTVRAYMPVFFRHLRETGEIDRAAGLARNHIRRDRPDWWSPALFMRVPNGRIYWYDAGFIDGDQGRPKWGAITESIKNGRCLPIIGPGLLESLLGDRRAVAAELGRVEAFPLSIEDQHSLPHVTQYVAQANDAPSMRDKLTSIWKRRALGLGHPAASDASPSSDAPALDELIAEAMRQRLAHEEEPYRALAQLDAKVYITTDPFDTLETALRDAGKEPTRDFARWSGNLTKPKRLARYVPSVKEPLVFYMFGAIRYPESLVLTEDDYLDLLIWASSSRPERFPDAVYTAMAEYNYLFLGFHLEDWTFRVLLRCILGSNRGKRDRNVVHVAAQVDPEEGRMLEPLAARRYLEEYFRASRVSIFSGTAAKFVAELVRQMRSQQ